MSKQEVIAEIKENIAEAQRGLMLLDHNTLIDVVNSALIMADGYMDQYAGGLDG